MDDLTRRAIEAKRDSLSAQRDLTVINLHRLEAAMEALRQILAEGDSLDNEQAQQAQEGQEAQ